MARKEIRISGFGGQGVVLLGHIIGKAASIYNNKNATLTQSYGPEARGGACSAQVIISEERISYPLIIKEDVLVAMSQPSYDKFHSSLKEEGLLIYDSTLVKPFENDKVEKYSIPASKIANDLGRQIVANIVMIGYFTAKTGIIAREAMENALKSSVPSALLDLNIAAFEKGFDYK